MQWSSIIAQYSAKEQVAPIDLDVRTNTVKCIVYRNNRTLDEIDEVIRNIKLMLLLGTSQPISMAYKCTDSREEYSQYLDDAVIRAMHLFR